MRSKTKYFIIALLFALIAFTGVGVSKWNIHIQQQFNDPFKAVDHVTAAPIIGRYIRIQNAETEDVLPGADLTYNGNPYTVTVTNNGNSGETNASTWTEWQDTGLTFTYSYTGTTAGGANYSSENAPKDAGTYTCKITAVAGTGSDASAKTAAKELNIYTASDGSNYAAEISFVVKQKEGAITGNITSSDKPSAANLSTFTQKVAPLAETTGTTRATDPVSIYFEPTISEADKLSALFVPQKDGNNLPYYDAKYNGATKQLTLDARFETGVVVAADVDTTGIEFEFKDADGKALTDLTNASNDKIYTATAKSTNPNYKVINYEFRFKIVQRIITVTIATDHTSVYGDPIQDYNYTGSDLASGDDIKDIVSITVKNASGEVVTLSETSNAGTYTMQGAQRNDNQTAKNYSVTTITEGRYEITKRPLKVTIDNATSVYGDPIAALTCTGDNLVNSDDIYDIVSLSTTAKATSNVGPYNIEGVQLTSAVANNYEVTFANNGTYTITKRPITVKIDDKSSIYGNDIETLTCSTNPQDNVAINDGLNNIVSLSTEASATAACGTYPITGTQLTNGVALNYTVTFENGTYAITKRTISLTYEKDTFTYTGNVQHPTVELNNKASHDTLEKVISVAYNGGTDVGSYKATITLTDTTNYQWAEGTATEIPFTITPADITATVSPYTGTYDNAEHPIATVNSTTVGGQTATIKYTLDGTEYNSAPNIKDAGSYTFTVTITAPNHNEWTGSYTATIQKIKLAKPTRGSNAQFTFNGEPITYYPDGFDSATMNITGNTQTNRGRHSTVTTLKDPDNYEWSDGTNGSVTIPFTIDYLTFNPTKTEKTFTYNGSNQYNDILTNGVKDGQNNDEYYSKYLNVAVEKGGTTVTDCIDAGDYTFVFTLKDSNNTTFFGSDTEVRLTFTISKATIDLNGFSPVWECFDGDSKVSFTGTPPTASHTGNELRVEISNLNTISLPTGITGVDVTTLITINYTGNTGNSEGDYTANATISPADANNYTVINMPAGGYTLDWKISTIITVTVPTNGNSYTYTGENQYDAILRDFGFDDATMNVTVTGKDNATVTECVNAGTYTFTFTLPNTTDYVWSDGSTAPIERTATISPADITATVTPYTETYDGQAHDIATVTNVVTVGGQTATITYTLEGATPTNSVPQITNAGSYNFTVTISAPNHNDLTVTDTATIGKIQLEKTTADTTEFIYNGAPQTYNPTNFDSATMTISGHEQTNADTYTVTVSITDKNNYVWKDGKDTDVTFEFEIKAKAITVTWSTTPLTYKGTNQIPEYTLSDTLCGSDTLTTTVEQGNAVVTSYANAGSYSVTLSATSNYTLTNPTTNFTINPKTLTITNTIIELGYNEVTTNGAVSRAWKDVETTLRKKITLDGVVGSDNVTVITKTLTNGDITYNYNGATSYTATYPNNYNNTSVTSNFVGSTYQATSLALINNDNNNYVLAENSTYYLKYKTVWHQASGNIDAYDNSTLYTIEDALNAHSSGTIIVELNTSFTGVEIAKAMGYLDDSGNPKDNYYNVRCTLLVPYAATANIKEGDKNIFSNAKESGGSYNTGSISDANDRACTTATTAKTTAPNRNGGYSALVIPGNLNINVTGTLTVNAAIVMTTSASSYVCGSYYGEMIVNSNAKITIESGATFNCIGFSRGSGSIVANSNSKVNEPLSLTGYKGHDATLAMSDLTFPINQFTLANLSCKVTLKNGANYYGKGYLHVHLGSGSTAIDLYIVKTVNLLGTTSSFFVQLDSGEFAKSIDESTGKINFDINGNVSINNMNIYNEKVPLYGRINISTEGRQIPLAGHFKFDVQSGTMTIPSGVELKFLPGAELTVNADANLVVNGGIYSYGGNNVTFPDGYSQFKDGNKAYPVTATANCYRIAPTLDYTATKPATFTIEGTATFNNGSTFGVEISGLLGGKLVINTSNVSGTVVEDNTVGSTANMYNVTLPSRGLNEDSSLTPLKQGEWSYSDGKWVGNYYQIIYNANGDSNAAPAYLSGEFSDVYAPAPITSSTITTPNPTRIYHNFTGWYYDAECTQKVGEAEHATPGAGDVINVYAGWSPIVYTVHFEVDRAGYSDEELGMPSGVTYSYGTTCVLPQPNFNIVGLEFSGWTIKSDYTGDISEITTDNIASLNITGATITLYGLFKQEDLITVRFNRNANLYATEVEAQHKLNSLYTGDELATVSSQVGGTVSLNNATSVLQGIDDNQHEYYFNGWNTKADGSGKTFTDTTVIEESDLTDGSLTLYAQWAQKAMIHAECFKDPKNVLSTVEIKLTPEGETTITIPSNEPATVAYYYYRPDTKIGYVLRNDGARVSSGNRKITGTRNNEGDIAKTDFGKDEGSFYMPAAGGKPVYIRVDANGSCVTPDTLVTLADGTQKRIDQVTSSDYLMVWNFFEGKYEAVPAAIIFNHGYGYNTQIRLTFEDGTVVKVLNTHQFFNVEENAFADITAETVASYVGKHFVQRNGNSYRNVKLVSYEITEEYVEAYGIISALHYNIFVENMLSADIMPADRPLFYYFAYGNDMKFDQAQMQADIEKYGLYTYEDFADYLTYEQFVAFNVQYMKISVGRGDYTYQGILDLIEYYLAGASNSDNSSDTGQNTSTDTSSENSGEVPIPPDGACDNALPPTNTATGSTDEDSSDDKNGTGGTK